MAGTFDQSLQCTQDVFVDFQAPSPPVGCGSSHGGSRSGRSCCSSSEEPIDNQKPSCGGRTPTHAPCPGSPEL